MDGAMGAQAYIRRRAVYLIVRRQAAAQIAHVELNIVIVGWQIVTMPNKLNPDGKTSPGSHRRVNPLDTRSIETK